MTLTFDLLTLVSGHKWRVTWSTHLPSLKILCLSVLELWVLTSPIGYHCQEMAGHLQARFQREGFVPLPIYWGNWIWMGHMGHGSHRSNVHDRRDPSKFIDPFDPWSTDKLSALWGYIQYSPILTGSLAWWADYGFMTAYRGALFRDIFSAGKSQRKFQRKFVEIFAEIFVAKMSRNLTSSVVLFTNFNRSNDLIQLSCQTWLKFRKATNRACICCDYWFCLMFTFHI